VTGQLLVMEVVVVSQQPFEHSYGKIKKKVLRMNLNNNTKIEFEEMQKV